MGDSMKKWCYDRSAMCLIQSIIEGELFHC